jgi:DNA-binding CsgD family transcriptional regulator
MATNMSTDEAGHLSQVIGHIYDAALDPALWLDVLAHAATFCNTATATIGSFDFVQQKANFAKHWGYDPHYFQLLIDRYIKINPLGPLAWLPSVGEVVSAGDLMPYEEYIGSAMGQEWGKPQGYVDSAQVVLEKTATAMAFFHVIRHERAGRVDDLLRRRMGLLAPHLRRAVLIGKVVDLHKVEAAALADTLDGIAAAMFLLDADARIVHANARGRAMLEDRDVLRDPDGKLCATDLPADQSLRDVVTAAGDGDAVLGARGITIPLAARSGERYVAHVLPLTSGARRKAGTSYSAVAAVFVREAALPSLSPVEVLVDLYRLTPAELRVMMAIVEIGGVPDVAPALGISETTVKTHLQRVFEKTGTNRQADLVKLVAGFMSPLAG